MLIEELNRQSCLELLCRTRLGRLACSRGAQPYLVPFYFACDSNYIYSFSTLGKKIEWMRVNPLVCVEADEVVSPQKWMSVIVLGRYEELSDTPEWLRERADAFSLLRRNAMWWEPAYAKTAIHDRVRSLEPVLYRIRIDEITGHRTTPEPSPDTQVIDDPAPAKMVGCQRFCGRCAERQVARVAIRFRTLRFSRRASCARS